jgi:hypothetical protein
VPTSFSKVLSQSSGKHPAVFSTSVPKTSPSSQVSQQTFLSLLLDEVKWGLRMPNRFAMRQLSLNYEDEVQK